MIGSRIRTLTLLGGDILCFYVALFATLFLRYQAIPSGELLFNHLAPFTIIFAAWVLVFFISGLYEKAVVLKSGLTQAILNVQLTNTIIAVLFFYFLPFFQITPKTNLFIVLALSFLLIQYWREYSLSVSSAQKRDSAILIASGGELKELEGEVNKNPRYGFIFVSAIDLDRVNAENLKDTIVSSIEANNVTTLIADFSDDRLDPVLPALYTLLFSNIRFIHMHEVYEDVFNKVPLSMLSHSWFMENISTAPKRLYDGLKRVMDIVLGFILLILSLPFLVLAFLAIKLEDWGPAFIVQERLGKDNKLIRIYKFRTMTTNDHGKYDEAQAKENKVTKVGAFLRNSRIDEFPQFWNVIAGSLSLVGPRPELPSLAKLYDEKVPYYRIRHILKPGLSGWAQIYHENHPHHGEAVEETKEKLSYDLYYVKNRSLLLDLKIALRTVQILLSRKGR